MALPPPVTSEKGRTVILFAALVAMGILIGAAAHTTLPVFLTASAAIALWLLAFGAREGLTRLRRR
ncbi:hypothetical protein [Kitasatospora sp. NPDC057223]|uniref:hypothetical protein n=1 Tax=Kitasatospora sp. NPDC057223 TaxID=3346055 RepID=UPI00362B6950